jgi:iron(II)-dependent oxidoreductase
MFHQLPVDRKIPQSNALLPAASPVLHQMIAIPAGTATLGLSRDSGIFGWDNEFEAFSTSVPSFEIDRYMVTNRQFVEFTMAGGYENRTLWSDDDWKWRENLPPCVLAESE